MIALALWFGLGVAALESRRPSAFEGDGPGERAESVESRALAPFRGEGADIAAVVERMRLEHAQSVRRALVVLDSRFDGWRDRSDALAEELLSWSTRGRLAWRTVRDVIDGSEARRRELVRDRFERMVVSEREIRVAVGEAFERLALELRADRARALSRVRAHVAAMRGVDRDSDVLVAEFSRLGGEMDQALMHQAERSLVAAVAGVAGAVVVTEVVTAAVVSAMAGASAGAATGAAGGSVVPVAGTIAGLAVGLAAGIAVDWWASATAQRDVAAQCGAAIDELRHRIIDGDRGLRATFEETAARDAAALEAHLRARLGEDAVRHARSGASGAGGSWATVRMGAEERR